MIDFRYHLVSIVSIFLALAVGIALGAGPLKSQIGDTFTSTVESLRADKTALKQQLDAANAAAEKRDAFTTASNRVLLAGRLSGVEIAVVVGPEGGIGPAELEACVAAGAVPVRLGPHVLRASTAGPAALAVLQHRLGRW